MDPRDVQKGFFDAVRKVTAHEHVQEELIEETPEVTARAYKRKYFTYVAGQGERYIRRCPR
ncbi:hypothetical protein LCGC14_2812730 [marine sediment metagenome]|uniref:Uncharacterized protein n=1 Tax=marine sediment metagenome TaxID=412755 RepID=A0A0F9BAR0_9ZZZZ